MISFYNALEITHQQAKNVFGQFSVEHIPVQVEEAENVYIVPCYYKKGMRTWWTRRAQGVFDSNFKHIELLSDIRGERKIWWPTEETESALRNSEFTELDNAYYGGTIYDHFGHFLLDSLSKLYPMLPEILSNSLPVVFHYPTDSLSDEKVYHGYVGQFLKILGIEIQRVILVKEPLKVKRIRFHCATFSDASFSIKETKSVYPIICKNRKNGRRGFISKSKLTSGTGYVSQGEQIDEIFESLGFDVIYPETLTLEEQIAIAQEYEVLIGFPSSFFHLKLFCQNGARLMIMYPNLEDFLHVNFLNLDVGAEFYDSFIPIEAEYEKSPEGFAKAFTVDLAQIYEVARIIR